MGWEDRDSDHLGFEASHKGHHKVQRRGIDEHHSADEEDEEASVHRNGKKRSGEEKVGERNSRFQGVFGDKLQGQTAKQRRGPTTKSIEAMHLRLVPIAFGNATRVHLVRQTSRFIFDLLVGDLSLQLAAVWAWSQERGSDFVGILRDDQCQPIKERSAQGPIVLPPRRKSGHIHGHGDAVVDKGGTNTGRMCATRWIVREDSGPRDFPHGRTPPVAIHKFVNEIMVWREE